MDPVPLLEHPCSKDKLFITFNILAIMKYNQPPDFWNSILARALIDGELTVRKSDDFGNRVPEPSSSGLFRRSVGEPKGQIADWRASIEGSVRGVHVLEYSDRYEIHVDSFDPYKRPFQHILFDSPKTGMALLMGGIGAALFIRNLIRKK